VAGGRRAAAEAHFVRRLEGSSLNAPTFAFPLLLVIVTACANRDGAQRSTKSDSSLASGQGVHSRRAVTALPYTSGVDSAWLPSAILDSSPPGDTATRVIVPLRNGRRLDAPFWLRAFLGALPRASGIPLLVFDAVPCSGGCDVLPQIMVVSANAGHLDSIPNAYGYPGPVSSGHAADPESYAVVDSSRAFIGRCLSDTQTVVIWFTWVPDSSGIWRSGAYRVFVARDSLQGAKLPGTPPLAEVEERARTGSCVEIPAEKQINL
jgi:hypothetical protein